MTSVGSTKPARIGLRWWAAAAAGAAVVVFGVAGVLKLLDLPGFLDDLASWDLLPQSARLPLAVVIPMAEIAVAGMWLSSSRRRRTAYGLCLGMVVLYSAALGAHLAWSTPPDCACLGLITAHFVQMSDARVALVRNAVLAGVLVLGVCAGGGSSVSRGEFVRGRVSQSSVCSRGFTLIEVLLTIVVAGLLVVLLLPGLARTSGFARSAVSLSNLRQHASIFVGYTQDYRDVFPQFCDSGSPSSNVYVPELDLTFQLPYFAQHAEWNSLMAGAYYGGQTAHPSFYHPGRAGPRGGVTDYFYGCSFLADPLYWNEATRMNNMTQWRATRSGEVMYPSRKTLLTFPAFPFGERVEYGLVDGSAATIAPSEALGAGYPGGDGLIDGTVHQVDVFYFLHTRMGARGVDIRR